jgi:predicted AlkP superfamily phosphohydrolase/phosphomutase
MKGWLNLKSLGCTSFEVSSNKEATDFLIESIMRTLYHKKRMQQTKYLLENDFMTDEEWEIFLDLRWKGLDIPGVN